MMNDYNNLAVIWLAAAVISLLLGYGGFPAGAAEPEKTIIIGKTYTTNDPQEDSSAIFEETLTRGGVIYQLQDIKSQIINTKPEREEQTITVETPTVGDESQLEQLPPEATVVQNGITYYLVSSEVVSGVTEARTEYGKTIIDYRDVEAVDEIPETAKVTVIDPGTGKEYVEPLPQSGYTVTAEHWKDDFTFPVTIYSADAGYYVLGDLVIPRDRDLSWYGTALISYLGLPGDAYQVNSVTLAGEPFAQDGEWVQQAVACGSRRTVDVAAVYEGNVVIPSEAYYFFRCIYSTRDPDKGSGVKYDMAATATYQLTETENEVLTIPVQRPEWWYETVVFTILLIPVIGLAVFLILHKKRKKSLR